MPVSCVIFCARRRRAMIDFGPLISSWGVRSAVQVSVCTATAGVRDDRRNTATRKSQTRCFLIRARGLGRGVDLSASGGRSDAAQATMSSYDNIIRSGYQAVTGDIGSGTVRANTGIGDDEPWWQVEFSTGCATIHWV